MNINDIFVAIRESRLAQHDENTLQSMAQICQRHVQNEDRFAKAALDSVHEALRLKQARSAEDNAEKRHQVLIAEYRSLKNSVDRLSRPRWIDWAVLIAGAIAATASVVQLLR